LRLFFIKSISSSTYSISFQIQKPGGAY